MNLRGAYLGFEGSVLSTGLSVCHGVILAQLGHTFRERGHVCVQRFLELFEGRSIIAAFRAALPVWGCVLKGCLVNKDCPPQPFLTKQLDIAPYHGAPLQA